MRKIFLIAAIIVFTINVWGQTITDTDSRVGIGTTDPKAKLDVNGAIHSNQHYSSVATQYLGGSTQTGTVKIALPTSWSNTMLKIRIEGYEYSGNSRGKSWAVNVGGYNYQNGNWYNYYAEIEGAAPFNLVRLAHDGTKNCILLGTNNSTWNYATIYVADVYVGFGNTGLWGNGYNIDLISSEAGISSVATPKIDFYKDLNGRIGIGTTNPAQKLDVNGIINSKGVYVQGTSDARVTLIDNTTPSATWRIQNQNDLFKIIRDSGSGDENIMLFKSNGNVGIGTTTPKYKLAVKGTIGCGEVIVENVSTWADFVFEKDYNLMPLKELDNYIQENKHLPEIPTTAEVQENGVSVGEMNAKLLQKIEELTLYVIELKKENDEQSATNNELKLEIENLKKLIK